MERTKSEQETKFLLALGEINGSLKRMESKLDRVDQRTTDIERKLGGERDA